MTREEYKRAKRRWILQPLAAIAVFILLACIAERAGCIFAP